MYFFKRPVFTFKTSKTCLSQGSLPAKPENHKTIVKHTKKRYNYSTTQSISGNSFGSITNSPMSSVPEAGCVCFVVGFKCHEEKEFQRFSRISCKRATKFTSQSEGAKARFFVVVVLLEPEITKVIIINSSNSAAIVGFVGFFHTEHFQFSFER